MTDLTVFTGQVFVNFDQPCIYVCNLAGSFVEMRGHREVW